jgi:hypothetical protein
VLKVNAFRFFFEIVSHDYLPSGRENW